MNRPEADPVDHRRRADPSLGLSRPGRCGGLGAPCPHPRDPTPVRVRRPDVRGPRPPMGMDRLRQPPSRLARQQDRRHVEATQRRSASATRLRPALPGIRVRHPVAVRRIEADVQTHLFGRLASDLGPRGSAPLRHPRGPASRRHGYRQLRRADQGRHGADRPQDSGMFMRYVHTEDDPIRAAAETVANRRTNVVGGAPLPVTPAVDVPAAAAVTPPAHAPTPPAPARLRGLEDVAYTSKTKLGNYRPYRKRKGENRAAPPRLIERDQPAEEARHV